MQTLAAKSGNSKKIRVEVSTIIGVKKALKHGLWISLGFNTDETEVNLIGLQTEALLQSRQCSRSKKRKFVQRPI